MKIKVLGVDPALRNFGFAVATVDLETDQIEKVECLEQSLLLKFLSGLNPPAQWLRTGSALGF